MAFGATPISSAVAFGVTPVSGAVAFGNVTVTATPSEPHVFDPGMDKDSTTLQTSLSLGDLDAQRDDFGYSQRTFKSKPLHVPSSSTKEPGLQTTKRRARPSARQRWAARRRQMASDIDSTGAIAFAVSGVIHGLHAAQSVSKKHNRPNARQRRRRRTACSLVDDMTRCVPYGLAIGAASLQEWLGLSIKDAAFSAVCWLSRVEFGMGFLHHLGLMDLIDLLELSKGLSKIGAKLLELMWLNLRKTNFPLSAFSFHKHVLGAKAEQHVTYTGSIAAVA